MVNKCKIKNQDSKRIGRRDFIRKSALMCCMAHIPFAASGLPQEEGEKPKTTDVKPAELAGYCGLYCGACDIYQQRISKSGNELKKVLDAFKFGDFSNQVPGLEDYATFEKVLNNIITIFGQCAACQKGGGDPQCKIRLCCREKGYQTCAECSSFPCERFKALESSLSLIEQNLEEIKKIGLEEWCQKQQEMVDKGFKYSDLLS